MKYIDVIVTAFRINTICLILAPWIFAAMRILNIVRTDHDWIIFIGLIFGMTIAVYLNFGGKSE